MAEKTEKATPKKLRDARKKGQVAKSQDFPSAFTFVVSIATTLSLSGYLFQQLATYIISTFKMVGSKSDLQKMAPVIIYQAIDVIYRTSIPIALFTAITGMLVSFLIVGPMFSLEAMKPDIKRLNPIDNIKNMFKLKTVVELIKSILKISGAIFLIYTVVMDSLPEITATVGMSVLGIANVFNDFLVKVVVRIGIFFLVIAIFDLVYQKKNFEKEMKMEKFEVKQEYKDTEGDPHIKSKRRQTAQEIAYQEGPSAVKRAKAVITNPIHIAVAIMYNSETEPAPKIITMGKGVIADRIVKEAISYNVPIMRNVTLAQKLFEKGEINYFIPEETYQAVAEILRWLESMESEETIGTELFQ
ncbi:MAG: EscU/YscU/HrcU family type III secretion system export apparatus switch protein [Chlamydiae bacterium]|nr:EscU/YscU/HrcU family type III secretion system export apparatus switch protein [Chlamydiota bacterium]